MEKLSAFYSQHKTPVRIAVVAALVAVIVLTLALTSGLTHAGDGVTNPTTTAMTTSRATADTAATAKPNPTTTAPPTTAAATTKPVPSTTAPHTTAPHTTAPEGTVPFATAAAGSADYQSQWDAGYLVAIDNPDTSYGCAHIELTDEDRELLEALCYGEFGSGGFIGAAMIAQCVRDAMCFDGYSSVADVIKYCRYDGSTTSGTSDACIQAVRYVFDDDGSAVQHRMLYMYNPYIVKSAFHESQSFVLSYQGVRFFDRYGY